ERRTRTHSLPESWSMPETTRRAVRLPRAPRSLRPVAITTSASPAGPGEPDSLLDDFKVVIPPMPRPRGFQKRAQRLYRPPLLPDDPPELRGIDGQLEDQDSLVLERAHRHRFGAVDELSGHVREPDFDVRFRHVHHPSGGGARRARPVQEPLHGRGSMRPLLDPAVRLENIDPDDLGLSLRIVIADLVRDP